MYANTPVARSDLIAQDLHGLIRCGTLMDDGFDGLNHLGRVFGLKDISSVGDAERTRSNNVVGDSEERFRVFHCRATGHHNPSVTGLQDPSEGIVLQSNRGSNRECLRRLLHR